MFQLDEKNHSAMYIQVMDNIKELIMSDAWPEKYRIPSVRDLSEQLMINPNTVQKAYKELEREGYIYTVTGKGTFVSGKDTIKRDPEKVNDLLSKINESFRGLVLIGYSPEDAASLIQGKVMESLNTAIR